MISNKMAEGSREEAFGLLFCPTLYCELLSVDI